MVLWISGTSVFKFPLANMEDSLRPQMFIVNLQLLGQPCPTPGHFDCFHRAYT